MLSVWIVLMHSLKCTGVWTGVSRIALLYRIMKAVVLLSPAVPCAVPALLPSPDFRHIPDLQHYTLGSMWLST
jgi:hypothetical protein